MRLVSKNRIPYGGGYYGIVDPLTGVSLSGTAFDMVYQKAVEARKAAGVPVGAGFSEEVEKWICERYPSECHDVNPAMPRRKRLTLGDIVRVAKVLASLARSRTLVSVEEAERRAKVCVACPLNQSYSRPCSGCQELRNIILAIVGNRRTSVGDKLRVCGVCGCSLDAAVWMQLSDQCKGVTKDMRREFSYLRESHGCWKRCDEVEAAAGVAPAETSL